MWLHAQSESNGVPRFGDIDGPPAIAQAQGGTMTITTDPNPITPDPPEDAPAPSHRASHGIPKWALPVGLVLYVTAFGINVTGLIPGVDIDVPASAHLFAGVIGLIVLWRIAHLDKLAVGAMAGLLVVLTGLAIFNAEDPQDMMPVPPSAESPQLEATVAWIREEPNAENDNDFLLRNNQHPLVTVIGESEHEPGWFRVKVPGAEEGWMFGSLLSGLEDHGYSTGETRTGKNARLVDEDGEYNDESSDTGRLILISGIAGSVERPLYEVILSDGTESLVRQTDIRRF